MLRARLLIIATAVLVRLLMLGLFDPFETILLGDAEGYLHPRPGYRSPLYSLIASTIGAPGLIVALQMLVTIAAALFTHSRLPKHGFAVALAIAALPFFVAVEFKIGPEAITCQLLWIAFLLLAFPGRKWEPFLAGALLGLAMLTVETLLLLPLFMVPFAIWQGIGRRLIGALLAAYLVALPFQSPSQDRFGINFWVGTWERNPDWVANGIDRPRLPDYAFADPSQRPVLTRALIERDGLVLRDAAIDRIRSDPGFVLASWAIRYPRLWIGTRTDQITSRFDRGSIAWTATKLFFFGLNLAVLALGAWGAITSRNRLFLAPILYIGLVYIPFHNSETRYSLPAIAFLCFFAVEAIMGRDWPWLSRFRGFRTQRTSSPSGPPPPASG